MKTTYTILAFLMMSAACFAKTYTVTSGKWTDLATWNNDYPGTTIKSDDVVIITGQITANAALLVEGTLQVEKGAAMVGMKDLVISTTGTFVNNGNTVVKRIVNEGTINNNLLMEAMGDIENKGKIENNNNTCAGNNFSNSNGSAKGNGGAYFIHNNVLNAPPASFGKNVNVFYGNHIEGCNNTGNSQPFSLDAIIHNNSVVLSVTNNTKADVSKFVFEKSDDGKNFATIQTIDNDGNTQTNYTDNTLNSNLTYYRVTALNVNGKQTILPVATVKTPSSGAYTMATQ